MKLKYLLIVAFVVLSAIPLFSGLQFLNEHSGEHYREQYEDHLSSLSLIAKKRLLTTIDRIRDNTALISSRTQMRISLDQWNQTGDKAHLDRVSRIINDAKHALSHVKDISLFDQAGAMAASTMAETEGTTIDPQLFDRPVISLAKEGPLVVVLSTAPLEYDHRTVGYIRISFHADFLTDLVRDRAGLGETGEWLFAVRDKNGDALFAVPLKFDHKAAFERRVSRERTDVPITQALLGNEIVMSQAPDYREEPVLASTRYIEEMDWGLVAKVNESEVNRTFNRNRSIIYITEIAIILTAIAAGVALSFFISNPIERLKTYSSKVAKGSFDPPPEMGGWQEVKELTSHFSYMVKALQEMNDNLAARIEERTQDLQEANDKLEIIATQDPLTGLHNRRYFDTRYQEEFNRAKRYRHDLAVVILDLDHFKQVNDRYGHEFGDIVLRKVSAFLKSTARDTDILARIGGEEFCMILPETPEKASDILLNRLCSEIADIEFILEDKKLHVTCSFGVAHLGEESTDADALLKQADIALYKAKAGGRNRVVHFSGEADPAPDSA